MKYLKNNRIFGTLFALSSVLMAVACFTITNTFSYPEQVSQAKRWSVSIKDVKTNNEGNKVNVVNDKMDLSITLGNFGEYMAVNSSVVNDGNFNALLSKVELTDISNIKVGTSEETGRTYYLSDYVDISLKYAKDNKTNGIESGANVASGDLLNKYTKNEVVVSVKYKEQSDLTEDEVVVLKQNIQGEAGKYPLQFSLSVGYNYIENTL